MVEKKAAQKADPRLAQDKIDLPEQLALGNEAAQAVLAEHAVISAGLTNEEADEVLANDDLGRVTTFGGLRAQYRGEQDEDRRKRRAEAIKRNAEPRVGSGK